VGLFPSGGGPRRVTAVGVGSTSNFGSGTIPTGGDWESRHCPFALDTPSGGVNVQFPDHLVVNSDTQETVDCGSNPSSTRRFITYIIDDATGQQMLSSISMRENVPVTTSSCNGSVVHTGSSCFINTDASPYTIGQFTDALVPGCPTSADVTPCGFMFANQQWQWCPSGGSPTSMGTIGPVNAQNTVINVDGNITGFAKGTTFPK
jgi:hypothetical protein